MTLPSKTLISLEVQLDVLKPARYFSGCLLTSQTICKSSTPFFRSRIVSRRTPSLSRPRCDLLRKVTSFACRTGWRQYRWEISCLFPLLFDFAESLVESPMSSHALLVDIVWAERISGQHHFPTAVEHQFPLLDPYQLRAFVLIDTQKSVSPDPNQPYAVNTSAFWR